jgi:hypothetical protein
MAFCAVPDQSVALMTGTNALATLQVDKTAVQMDPLVFTQPVEGAMSRMNGL